MTFTHIDISPVTNLNSIANAVEVYEGDSIEGSLLGSYDKYKVPPPIVSTGNALTVHLISPYEHKEDLFAATYSSVSSGITTIFDVLI